MPNLPNVSIAKKEECGLYQENDACSECLYLKEGKCPLYMLYEGKIWEARGHRCEICGTYMGELYRQGDEGWINPFNYETYGDNTCRGCGQEYIYEEGQMMYLTEEQLEILRKHAGNPKPKKEEPTDEHSSESSLTPLLKS